MRCGNVGGILHGTLPFARAGSKKKETTREWRGGWAMGMGAHWNLANTLSSRVPLRFDMAATGATAAAAAGTGGLAALSACEKEAREMK